MITITKYEDCAVVRVENPPELKVSPGIVSRRIRRLTNLTPETMTGEQVLLFAIIDAAIADLSIIGRKYVSQRAGTYLENELHHLISARHFFRPIDPKQKHRRFFDMCNFLNLDAEEVIEALEVAGYFPELRINTITLPRFELLEMKETLDAGYGETTRHYIKTSDFIETTNPKKEAASYGV